MPETREPSVRERTEKLGVGQYAHLLDGRRRGNSLLGHVDADISAIPLEPDEDGNQQEHLLALDQLPRLADLLLERRLLGDGAPAGPVAADDLLRGRDEEGQRQAQALQRDEGQVRRVADLAAAARLDVERELDRRADELAELAETEPDAGWGES